MLTYMLCCVATDRGWRWKVTLRQSNTYYEGNMTYATYENAKRAALRTGAFEGKESR